MRKTIYIIIGCISVVLGIVGIFVPGLPTTPFLLLSSWLFYKSSKRLHDALHRSKWLGDYIRKYESGKGVSKVSKAVSIVLMWVMISISAFFFIENTYIRILLGILGIIGTCCVIFVVPGEKKGKS
ncbi:YbaN family protein [Porphyromonadaceae bacterium OttesenSCG-928-L07]|nr:YbaN family protein [Porphyromonadaceae bacterium OttesenSCG-928-L07]MDL2330795.1 YbaN family protein [Odoribacter sp. OttesenSCG-928-A06]